MPATKNKADLLTTLIKQGKITQAQADQVLVVRASTGKSVREVVLSEGLVKPDDLIRAQAEVYGIPVVNLSETAFSPQALNYIPRVVAERFHAIPFSYDQASGVLKVAMADPLDMQAVEFIEKKSGLRVEPYYALTVDWNQLISTQYQQSLSTEVTEALKDSAGPEAKLKINPLLQQTDSGGVIREAPIAKIVSTILEYAVKSRASDIHIEPLEDKTRVRYRVDGILREKLILPKKMHDSLVSRIKILAELKIDEKRIPQDGRFAIVVAGEPIDLRISTLPTIFGEKIVMRLLPKTSVVPTLPELGLRGKALTNLEDAIRVPHGIILITGPTGSGKTTTLYAILSKISTPRVNVMTMEDPVEYQIKGVNQVQVNVQAGLTFASGMRSFLRQDPNIIMVGEIRDKETAELAIQASLTGHLVFSTLHTNSAAGALPRLLDMGAETYLLTSSMTAVVAQRVLRRVCTNCAEEYEPPVEVVADIKKVLGRLMPAVKQVKLKRGKGCEACGKTGYKGRIGIYEVMPVTEKIGRLILERSSAVDIEKQAVEEGMMLMIQDGYLKALEGITTIEEVLRVART